MCLGNILIIVSFYVCTCSDLATELSTNATSLRQFITELMAEQEQLGATINRTILVVGNAESALQQVSYNYE
jgi:precorrin isomerase